MALEQGGVFPLDRRLGRWTELEFLNEYLPLTKTLGYSAFAAAPEGTYGYQANFPT